MTPTTDRFHDIRDAVRDLCRQFPDEYFRKVDEQRAYPADFVGALTKAGWLAALIPQEYGGSGLGLAEASVIMEEINRSGGNSGACHDTKDRVVFGRPIAQNQGVQFPIAESHIEVERADLMRWKACEMFDAHQPCGAEANMAKYLAAKASWEAANVCLQISTAQVIARLDAAQIANAHMNDMHDVWQHEQLKARGRWTDVDTPAGPLPALLPPGAPNAASVRMDPVPALGQHTDTILAELGYTFEEIAALRCAKAI